MLSRDTQIQKAVEFALAHEVDWSRDTTGVWGVHQGDPAPWNRLFGPVHPRGAVSAVILQHGKTVVEFGEPDRADLTFSVAKAYLALLAGVANDQGLLPEPERPVVEQLPGIGFDDGANRQVTWEHLLQQTSEWTGTCFDIPDQVDHFRSLAFAPVTHGKKGEKRSLHQPGQYWEYNDVRINQLSLALLHLFRRPLPDVFREYIAKPCGLSDQWRWVGYDHAWVDIDGERMPSVPGGSHWGAGVSISARDQAKLGQLMLDRGQAHGKKVISAQWMAKMQTPCPIAPFYGYLVWLNHDRKIFPALPEDNYFGMGAGGNFTLVAPSADIVAVVRWLNPDQANEFFGRVHDALTQS
jgi:CubicO group peptidase (beta-lactamase class C family)